MTAWSKFCIAGWLEPFVYCAVRMMQSIAVCWIGGCGSDEDRGMRNVDFEEIGNRCCRAILPKRLLPGPQWCLDGLSDLYA